MAFADENCVDFIDALAAKQPTPGGGGAAAYVGALGTALGRMVCAYTVGKKKYADVEKEIFGIEKTLKEMQDQLAGMVDRDAAAFKPLSEAYGLPKDAPDREVIMENALRRAATVPVDVMCDVCSVIEYLDVLAEKGSRMVISDAGVAAECCKAALRGAALNVYINTKSMTDREYAELIDEQTDAMLKEYVPMADRVYEKVLSAVR